MRRRAALAPLLAFALALLPPPAASGGDLTAEEQRFAKDMVAALGANSPRVRKAAEEAIARLGVDALPTIAEALPQVKGESALKGLRRALEGMGRADVLAALGRLTQGATTRAVAKRYEDVAALLGGGAGADVPNSMPLQPVPLEDWTLAPLALEERIEGRLPERLAPGSHVARREGDALRIDADGDGTAESVVPGGPGRVVEVGPAGRRTRLLVYAKAGAWYACPASMLRGGTGSGQVELLDADSDGEFDGAGDYVRVGDGAFGLEGEQRRLRLDDGVYSYRPVREAAGWRLALVREPASAGFEDAAQTALEALDRWRRTLGLPPARLDPARCDACKKHALYLQRNAGSPETAGLGVHRELEGKPGYTTEGAGAATQSVISSSGDPAAGVGSFTSTMLHGTPLLGSPAAGFGVGCVAGRGGATVLWGADPGPTDARAPFVVPAPGQRRVPLRGAAEEPPPEQPANWYGSPRGFPISVFPAGLGLSHVAVRLYLADGKTEIPGRLWNEDAPIRGSYGRGVGFFMPAQPLEPKTAYLAVVSGRRGDADVSWAWSFRTD